MKNVDAHNRLIYLIVVAILLSPVHLGYYPSAHAGALSPESMAHDEGAGHCDHADQERSFQKCPSHMGMGGTTIADDCCGENCFGSQISVPVTYAFHPITHTYFQFAHSVRPPEPLVTAEFRPPILFF